MPKVRVLSHVLIAVDDLGWFSKIPLFDINFAFSTSEIIKLDSDYNYEEVCHIHQDFLSLCDIKTTVSLNFKFGMFINFPSSVNAMVFIR